MKAFNIRIVLCSLIVFVTVSLTAQEKPPILATPKLEKGIYRNFQEFVNNAPSIRAPFLMISHSGKGKIEKGMEDYKLMLQDSATKRRDLKKFWGACDGETIYINEASYEGPVNFKRVHGMGRYCYFKGSYFNTSKVVAAGVVAGAIGAAVAAGVEGDYPYILNINNGKFFLLDKDLLKTILKKDEELNALYDDEQRRSKKNTLLSYIVKYNERHEDEIKYNRPDPISVAFYRKQKKERLESMTISVGDTIQLSLDPHTIKNVTWMSDSLDVCVGSNCRTIPLDKKKINYVECSWKSELQEFEKVESKVGEFYEREISMSKERK